MKLRRNEKGYQFAELGPALIVIFVIVLVPMLDMLYLSLAYAAGWYCNHLVVREVAVRDPSTASTAASDATSAWTQSTLAKFIGAGVGQVNNVEKFFDAGHGLMTPTPGGPPPVNCEVDTTVIVKPFLPIPFVMSVPGMNAPVTFAYSAERPQEEKGVQ